MSGAGGDVYRAGAPTHLAGHLHKENQIFGTAWGPAGIVLLIGKLKLKVQREQTFINEGVKKFKYTSTNILQS